MHDFPIQTFEELALRLRPDGAGSCIVQVVRSPYGCRDVHFDLLLSLGRIEGQKDLGLRIRLIFDPLDPHSRQLLALPWELLYRYPETRSLVFDDSERRHRSMIHTGTPPM